jgi:hypothetical protein
MNVQGPLVFSYPTQLTVFERGSAAGLLGAGGTITTAWFDTHDLEAQEIIVPQSGAIVRTDDETNLGIGLTGRFGLYYLDLFSEHTNALNQEYQLEVQGQIAGALVNGGFPIMDLAVFRVQAAEVVTGTTRPFNQTVRIYPRFCRLVATYPATASTRFHLSAVLRSA